MLSNDILRSVRYILKANNNDLVRILALGNVEATAEQIAVWLRKEDEEGFQRCPDIVLSSFLNGLIYEKRGKDESAPAHRIIKTSANAAINFYVIFCVDWQRASM